jgi:hypothetical protein
MSEPYLEQLYQQKYLKYKNKYLELKNLQEQKGGIFDTFACIFTTQARAEQKDLAGKTILTKLETEGQTMDELINHFSNEAYCIIENSKTFNLMLAPNATTLLKKSGSINSSYQSAYNKPYSIDSNQSTINGIYLPFVNFNINKYVLATTSVPNFNYIIIIKKPYAIKFLSSSKNKYKLHSSELVSNTNI